MRKYADHGERSDDLVAAATRVIVRGGVEAASPRAIAAEAGIEGDLTHSFVDLDETLLAALDRSHQLIAERWATRLAGIRGLEAIRSLLLDNLPLDEGRELETRLEVNAWNRALTSARVARVQSEDGEEFKGLLRVLVGIAYDTRELVTDEPLDDLVDRLLALVDGLSLHLLLYPDRLTREQAQRIMSRELERLAPS